MARDLDYQQRGMSKSSYRSSYTNTNNGNNSRGTSLHGGPKYKTPTKIYSKEVINPNNNNTNESFYKFPYSTSPKYSPLLLKPFEAALDKGAEKTRRFFGDPDYKRGILPGADGSVLSKGKYKPLSTKKTMEGAGSKAITQKEFNNMSLTEKNKVYENYSKLRSEGKIDAYGNTSANFRREFIVHSNADGTKEYRETFLKTDNNGGNNSNTKSTRSNVVTKKNVGGKTILTTEGKVAEDKKTKTKYDERETKKKGRRKNTLTSSKGVMKTSADYSLGKKSLLGQVV